MLKWLIAPIVHAVLDWLKGFVLDLIARRKREKQNDESIDKEMKRQADALENAKTDKEENDAISDILGSGK